MIKRRSLMQYGLAAVAGAMPLALPAATPDYGITGRHAPELKVDYWIDRDGEDSHFTLAGHQGKWIFLKCFQSWCPGCHSHGFPALQKISTALENNAEVVFAGIQTVFEGRFINTVDKLREIQLRYDLRMPMGHDPGPEGGRSQTMMDYRTGGTPWMILISPQGEVIFNDYGIDVDKAIAFLAAQTA